MDWDLLDIDRDGDHDFDDLAVLGNHLYKIPQPPNTYGIGRPVAAPITASLDPSPQSVRFEADGEDWRKFTVRVTGGASVEVVVNSLSLDALVLEIHKGRGRSAPTRSFCGAERNDSKTVVDGDIIWIAGCAAGNSSIFVQDQDGNYLEEFWSIDVHPVRTADTSFDIEFVFVGSPITGSHLTAREVRLARQAADRWESVITEGTEDISADVDSDDWDWWENWTHFDHRVRLQRTIDDILIYIGKAVPDTDEIVMAYGGAFWVRASDGRPILGQITMTPVDWSTIDAEWGERYFEDIFLHEIGHVLGIGASEGWDDLIGAPSTSNSQADTYFFGAGALASFGRIGGRNYRGNKVPVENGGDDSHWRESVFGDELMSPLAGLEPEALSEVTLHALDDLGYYQVDLSQADPYTLPPVSKPVARAPGAVRCKALRPPPGAMGP